MFIEQSECNRTMTRVRSNRQEKRWILVVVLLTAFTFTQVRSSAIDKDAKPIRSSTPRERRHIGVTDEISNDKKEELSRATDGRIFKSTSSKSNEINAEAGRKASNRLIGGHSRDDKVKPRDSWKTEDMLASSAGNGRETKNPRAEDDDERKTLSQQVKEGKYGLIQNEIYEQEPRRPGIISYRSNPEVPKDTIDNLGGLDEDEIWMAENHVLVLRGGHFPGQGSTKDSQAWPPIDNYQAPRRQVKIPAKPRVPPPFPVQLRDGGPVQLIGINGSTEIENVTLDRTTDPVYGKGVLPGDGPFFTVASNGTIIVPDFDYPVNVTSDDAVSDRNEDDDKKKTKSEEPPIFYHAIPPGAVFVPPPGNKSDYDDEDQSIYYPPPYSFHYPQDNSTAVPPGPLVPGIILPPPADFFSPLEEKKPSIKKYTKLYEDRQDSRRSSTSSPIVPKARPTYLPPRKLTTKYRESATIAPKISTTQRPRTRTYVRPMIRNLTRTIIPKVRTSTVPYAEVTTVAPDKPSTLTDTKYYTVNPFVGNGVTESSNSQKVVQTWSRSTNAKSLPIVTYYSTTTPTSVEESVEESVEVTPATVKNVITTTDQPGHLTNRASYYFYEESNDDNVATTVEPPVYYQTTVESPYYKVEPLSEQPRNEKQHYRVDNGQPKDSRDYNVKLIDSLIDNPQVYRYSDSDDSRVQNERTFPNQTPIYYQTIQSYYTTPKPPNYYKKPEERVQPINRQHNQPKPIYQYSFQVTDYAKRAENHRPYYKEQNERVVFGTDDYRTVKPTNQRYDYNDNDRRRPVYSSTTSRPIVNVTPNPQHAYFTRQEERLLDDVTKEYFTIFGKKLGGKDTPSTTPIYKKSSHVTEKPDYGVNTYVPSDYNVPPETTYQDQVYYNRNAPPANLESDTRVNYRQPLPPIDPDSEFIEVFDSKERGQPYERLLERPISLHDDILVNYRHPRPQINPDAEFIEPVRVPERNVQPEKSSAYFAYRLPGDSGHFYFLTPQAINSRQEEEPAGNNAGYFYPKPRGPKLLRRRRDNV